MHKVWFVAIYALFVAAPGAQAQTIRSPFQYVETKHSIGLYGGYLNTQPGELGISADPAPIFGARYSLYLTGPISMDAAVGVSPTSRIAKSRVEGTTTLEPVAEVDALMLDARAGFVFHVTGPRTWRGLAPYIMATAGIAMDLASRDPAEAVILPDQQFNLGPALAITPGIGVEYFVSKRLSFRLEGTDHLWRLTYPATLSNTGEKSTEWLHNPGISVGSSVHF